MLLSVKNIYKTFDAKKIPALGGVSFDLRKGEILSIIGSSGTGKSTLAKIIVGSAKTDSGEFRYSGSKKIVYVPQELSLDEEKTIFENIKDPLIEIIGSGDEHEDELHHRVRDMIEVFGLQYKDHKFPRELSTGQKQRVEIAKAFVTMPELVIFDEPFSNLDVTLKREIQSELSEYISEKEISCIFVTHDLEESFSISDRIILMGDGEIKQDSTPKEMYHFPKSAYVAKFTGRINLLASHVVSRSAKKTKVKNSLGEFEFNSELEGKFLYQAFRPESCILKEGGQFRGVISRIEYCGAYQILFLKTEDQNLTQVKCSGFNEYKLKQKVSFDLKLDECFLLTI